MSFRGEDTLPPSMATLVRQLDGGGAQAPWEVLSPVTAVEELKAVASAMLVGRRPPHKRDCVSLKIDLQQALSSLGPVSQALHATAIRDFRTQIGRLDETLVDAAGARVLHADADVMLAELRRDCSLIAAFDDCVAAFDSNAFVAVCESRLRYLRTLIEAAGHDWSERSHRLRDAVAGSYRALLDIGALDPPHVGQRLHFDDAGLQIDERLWLARRILTMNATHRPVVVWLVYANAFVNFHVQKGPIDFYDSRIWPAVLDGHWPGNPGWVQPPELQSLEVDFVFNGLPEENFVIVRVALDGPVATARERARSLARAAVELTGWESDWVLMEGECGYATGWFGSTGFTDPRERALRQPGSPVLDPTAIAVEELKPELLDRIAKREPAAAELLADTRWRRTIRAVPDAEHRVALLVALFERALVPSAVGSDRWYEACKRYFELLLSFDHVHQQIWDAGHYGVHALSQVPGKRQEFLALDKALIVHGRGHSLSVDVRLKEVIRSTAALRAHLDPASMEARMLAEVEERTRDGAAAAAWVAESRRRFERLLARARRQRNAIAHGTRTVPGALATVEPFLDRIAGRLIGALHYSVSERRDLTTELQALRLARLQTQEALAAGGRPELLAG